ncbi:helix-turn-helix transcriptional regulator [Desulfitobacterium sp. AusDCA]|uniref:AraC family transcriptional regulator n=1 Tax=Desulfitobacterium sp. AusDCA TaxID=3240383 RepID=UPI003DA77E68
MLDCFNRKLELSDRLETDYSHILHYDFPSEFTDTYKTYENSRLWTILEGEISVFIDQYSIPIDNQKFLLLLPEASVKVNIEKPTNALVFELNDSLLKKAYDNLSTDYETDCDQILIKKIFCASESLDFHDTLGRIVKALNSKGKNMEYLLNLYSQELIFHLLQVKGVSQLLNLKPENLTSKAIQYMNDKYMLPITIKQISSQFDMSEANFSQCFKKATGINPKEYLTNLRMEKAKKMITHSSVTDTAFDLGYRNVSRFITLFKEKYGVTPKQYQKNIF